MRFVSFTGWKKESSPTAGTMIGAAESAQAPANASVLPTRAQKALAPAICASWDRALRSPQHEPEGVALRVS